MTSIWIFIAREKYEEAISGFQHFLDEYPKSKLADNAAFWIGRISHGLKAV